MSDLIRLGVGIVLLLITLSIALSFLSRPIALVRRSGVLKACKGLLWGTGRGLGAVIRVLARTRKPRIRRPVGRLPAGRAR